MRFGGQAESKEANGGHMLGLGFRVWAFFESACRPRSCT